MNIHSIYYFLQVAKYRSYSTASRKLYVAQSSISTTIKKLEEELSVKLFSYDGKSLSLTPEGSRFYDLAHEFYLSYDNFAQSAKQLSSEIFGTLRIILPPHIMELYFAKPIAAFLRQYPDVLVVASYRGGHVSQNLILADEFDLGVVPPPLIPNSFESIDLVHDPMVLAVHQSHPFAQRKSVTYAELKEETFLAYEEDSILYRNFITRTTEAGFTPHIVAQAPETPFLLSMVEENSGIMVIPKCVADYRTFKNVRFIDIEGEENGYMLVMIRKKDKLPSPAAQAFLDFIRDWFCVQEGSHA
ncbi:MAG: LysR family transcriptional regulator [Firmicutes bacterium]|nr:LysR family transcriptional regulator [Bacillota bacterium]MBR6969728.1 LysR family transcriptional regulator [Bacillota bacterium]